jgi:hypothetical protein
MNELQVGDRIRDNDPRMPGRVLTVITVLPQNVYAKDSTGRVFGYLRCRIYTDGKPRKSGFSKVAA